MPVCKASIDCSIVEYGNGKKEGQQPTTFLSLPGKGSLFSRHK